MKLLKTRLLIERAMKTAARLGLALRFWWRLDYSWHLAWHAAKR
jgi:hypothetical protein